MEFDLNKKYCYYFNEISKIPRGSRNEKAISDYVVDFAKAHGYDYKQDVVELHAHDGQQLAGV